MALLQPLRCSRISSVVADACLSKAFQRAPLGVTSTLMRLAPIFLLPVGCFYFNERSGWGSVIGTVISVIGVGMLFFRISLE